VTIGLYVESERFSNGARGTRKPCEIGAKSTWRIGRLVAR